MANRRFEELRDLGFFVWFYIIGSLSLFAWVVARPSPLSSAVLESFTMTALLFGFLLPSEYPPKDTPWFWKTVIPTVLLHALVIYCVFTLEYVAPSELRHLTRMKWGFVGTTTVVEYSNGLFVA
jgi:hypothetical protein